MTTRILAACGVAAVALACGGSGSSSSVNGTIHGSTISVGDTVSGNVTIPTGNGGSTQAAAIVISSMGNLCSNATSNKEAKNSRTLIFFVGDYNSAAQTTTAPTAAGTYTVTAGSSQTLPPKVAFAAYSETDASCQAISAKSAAGVSGSVTLTSVNNGNYAGSFDVTFDSGDHVTGSFSGTNCAGLQTAVNSNSTTCI